MSTTAPSPLLPWRTRAGDALAGAKLAIAHRLSGLMAFGTTREAGVAACAAWAFRAVRRLLQPELRCIGPMLRSRTPMNSSQDTPKFSRMQAAEPTLGAAMRARFARAGSSIWRALEAHGRARAWREIRELADRCEATQPELARQLRAANRYIARR